MLFKRYRVVFTGEFHSSKDLETIKSGLMKRFNLSQKIIERLLTGRPVAVKHNINAETAFRYKQAIDDVGAISRIEEEPDDDDVDEFGFVDRRKSSRRMYSERRKHYRAEAIQPDRRKKERRKGWSSDQDEDN